MKHGRGKDVPPRTHKDIFTFMTNPESLGGRIFPRTHKDIFTFMTSQESLDPYRASQ
jgi:hypothetical protein